MITYLCIDGQKGTLRVVYLELHTVIRVVKSETYKPLDLRLMCCQSCNKAFGRLSKLFLPPFSGSFQLLLRMISDHPERQQWLGWSCYPCRHPMEQLWLEEREPIVWTLALSPKSWSLYKGVTLLRWGMMSHLLSMGTWLTPAITTVPEGWVCILKA